MPISWCWENEEVFYGTLVDNEGSTGPTDGRFKADDIRSLISSSRWSFIDKTPEEIGLTRESEECCACNDYKWPPCENCTDDPPPDQLIQDVKADFEGPTETVPADVRLELVPNTAIDRVQLVRVTWDFGDGQTAQFEDLFGSRTGFIQNHTYNEAGFINGTVKLALLDSSRSVIKSETANFSGEVFEEEQTTPLSLFLSVSQSNSEAPATVSAELTANQAIESIVWDWGDGTTNSGQTTRSHEYNQNGTFVIEVAAKSKASGEVQTVTKTIILEEQIVSEPPKADVMIIDVKRTIGGDGSLVAPVSINYELVLNDLLQNSEDLFVITWDDGISPPFSFETNGSKRTGFRQTFNYDNSGFFNASVTLQRVDRLPSESETQPFILDEESRDLSVDIQDVEEPEVPSEEPPLAIPSGEMINAIVRKISNNGIAPAKVQYQVILNDEFEDKRFQYRISWDLGLETPPITQITNGEKQIGFKQDVTYTNPGFFSVQMTLELLNRDTGFPIKVENKTLSVQIFDEDDPDIPELPPEERLEQGLPLLPIILGVAAAGGIGAVVASRN